MTIPLQISRDDAADFIIRIANEELKRIHGAAPERKSQIDYVLGWQRCASAIATRVELEWRSRKPCP